VAQCSRERLNAQVKHSSFDKRVPSQGYRRTGFTKKSFDNSTVRTKCFQMSACLPIYNINSTQYRQRMFSNTRNSK